MPFNGSGTFAVYTPGTPYVNGTTIDETVVNAVQSDFATGLTNCVTRDGQSPPTANLPMGTFRHTGVGNATTRSAATYASAGDVQDGTLINLTGVAGTNTITATAAISMTSYATGQLFVLNPANTNTGATTLNLNSIGAKNIFWNGAACAGNELQQSVPALVQYDGTQFNIIGPYFKTGSWTPGITFGGGSTGLTYTTQSGTYTKTGRLVTARGKITLSAKGSSTGTINVTGLPFAVANTTAQSGGVFDVGWQQTSTSYIRLLLQTNANATTASLYGLTVAATSSFTTVADTDVSATFTLYFTLVYEATG